MCIFSVLQECYTCAIYVLHMCYTLGNSCDARNPRNQEVNTTPKQTIQFPENVINSGPFLRPHSGD